MSVLCLWSAEFQESYVVGIMPEDYNEFEGICRRERVPCDKMGWITGDGHVRVIDGKIGAEGPVVVRHRTERYSRKIAAENFSRQSFAAESDIHGAVSSVLLEAATREEQPVFFPEYTIRHPANDNAVLLWHGTAPLSLRHPDVKRVRIEPPWILTDLPPACPRFPLRDGPLTVCRFDGDTGDYRLGIGQGKTVTGPDTREFHVWMEVDDWPRWERLIMEGPYIHHCSAVYEHCADALEEACRYIPHLEAQRFDRPD